MVYKTIEEIPSLLREKLTGYVSNLDQSTFVLRNLPPEVRGAVFARFSRAPYDIRVVLANEFLDENGEPSQSKGSALVDRVVNAFGDDSVSELESVHVGIEGISQIGTKWFEDRRIGGSPIERSTRYVRYDQKDTQGKWRYLRPREIAESGSLKPFETATDFAFSVYAAAINRLKGYFEKVFPKTEFTVLLEREGVLVKVPERELSSDEERKQFNDAYCFTIRCAALDVGRCILPASALTQFGIFGNGRYFRNVITYLKSNELQEAQERGFALERELAQEMPTFIKKNRCNPNIALVNQRMFDLTAELFRGITPENRRVTLVRSAHFIDEVVAGSLFPYANISFQQITDVVKSLPHSKKTEILEVYKGMRENRKDRTGRGLEAGYPITFDLVGNFGEFRDLERHRILTQQRQLLTTELGFNMPAEVIEVGLESEVKEVVAQMDGLNSRLRHAGLELAAQYATLFNHRMRFMFGMNLRELQHLAELRTQPAGHYGYRSMVIEMVDKLVERDPWASTFLQFVDRSDPGNKIARAKEQGYIAGQNLRKGIGSEIDLE